MLLWVVVRSFVKCSVPVLFNFPVVTRIPRNQTVYLFDFFGIIRVDEMSGRRTEEIPENPKSHRYVVRAVVLGNSDVISAVGNHRKLIRQFTDPSIPADIWL